MGRGQDDALFVFDEPTIGLHPENVATLMAVFERLVEAGATVIVIEHDLDVIRAADWMIDLGPGGGDAGGTVVFEGVPRMRPQSPEASRAGISAVGLKPALMKTGIIKKADAGPDSGLHPTQQRTGRRTS